MLFKDIKGHSKQIESLKLGIRNNRLAGAYFFTGPEGIGKALVAKAFASTLNCLVSDQEACGSCTSCRKIQNSQHPDIHIIDNGCNEEIKIEDIRRLQDDINLRPYEGRYKVFIINNCHNLNLVSANAFLKTLEEPPKHSIIVLISDKPALILNTITSRCQVIRFNTLSRPELEDVLIRDHKLTDSVLHYLVYFSEGRLGSALKLKDRDILNEKNRIIDALSADEGLYQDNFLVKERSDFYAGLQILAGWFRDIYILKIGMPESVLINLDRRDTLVRLAQNYTFGQLDDILNGISDSLLYLDQNVNIKLLMSNLSISLSLNH